MTEAEWRACREPTGMLEFLRGRASDRKLRLFACACCKRIWHLLREPTMRSVVEGVEQFAEGGLDLAGLRSFYRMGWECDFFRAPGDTERDAAITLLAESAAGFAGEEGATYAAVVAARWAALARGAEAGKEVLFATGVWQESAGLGPQERVEGLARADPAVAAALARESAAQARLVRDVFGNPFHPVVIEPAFLTPNVVALAQTVNEERELSSGHFDRARLAVLADALLDAGCDNPDILEHCRGEGPHVRGCWVVDLILGKQ